jgi:hypothetical protein
LGRSAGDGGFEHVEVAHLLDAANGLFRFEAVHGGLDGGVGGPVLSGKVS